MVTREKLLSSIQQIIEGIIHPPADGRKHYMEDWDWFQGVALFGMYRYWRESGDEKVHGYLKDWFTRHIEAGLPEPNINSVCPLLTLSYLYEEEPDEKQLTILKQWLEIALHELPRAGEGGLQHKTIDSDNAGQLWDDTLYMTVLFVARMGVLLKREDCIQESIRQFLVHIKYLTDPATGLFFHGWTFVENHHFGGALWGRGNAWYTAGLVDYLEIAPVESGVRMFLVSTLKRQVEALKKYQDAEGMWHTLINLPESSYQEASATAGFAYGILKAVRMGDLPAEDRPMAEKALEAILQRIDENGILTQVSSGTCVGKDLDYYRNIKCRPQPYGQSLALLLFTEALHLV